MLGKLREGIALFKLSGLESILSERDEEVDALGCVGVNEAATRAPAASPVAAKRGLPSRRHVAGGWREAAARRRSHEVQQKKSLGPKRLLLEF